MKRRKFLCLTSGILYLGSSPGNAGIRGLEEAPPRRARTAVGPAFGSYWRIAVPAEVALERLENEVRWTVGEIDAALSPYDPQSELSRFNASSTTDWQPISPLFEAVIAAARSAARITGGAFDPTVGAAVARQGFGPIETGGAPLDALESRPGAIRRDGPVTLDLCGIAKGHALDLIAAAFRDRGVSSFLIELGGEMIASGWHPADRRWHVSVEAPGLDAPRQVVALGNRALATAGRCPFGAAAADGRSHIVDPRTGLAAADDLGAVTVLAETAAKADALATGLYAAGRDGALELAETHGLDAVIVMPDGAQWRRFVTGDAGRWLLA